MLQPTTEIQAFRQVHLDFHTSECIPEIGARFDRKQFQETLKKGHVNSINLSAKSLDGWAYFDAKTNERHPGLDFNLLDEEISAAREIGVITNLYVSCGCDEKMARRHPEWLRRDRNNETVWAKSFDEPGYHQFCFNTPYLDYLLPQIEEILLRYGESCHGLWLDIVGVRECYCPSCVAAARERGIDPEKKEEMALLWEESYRRYTDAVEAIVQKLRPGCLIFHNGGHIRRGRRDLAYRNTHLDIESLPTGGWGYQHLPLSARYAQTLGMEYTSMTGRFHTTWGEFGGYKHPNALRYEAALSIANGAKVCVGDHLHPDGRFDEVAYALIGRAYGEVEEKEAWCRAVTSVADVALLSTEAVGEQNGEEDEERTSPSDSGCVRMLLEGKYLYDVIDTEAELSAYKAVILPDSVTPDGALTEKLRAYAAAGGKVLATGASCVDPDGKFVLDLGAVYEGVSGYSPTYCRPTFRPEPLEEGTYVVYGKAYTVRAAEGARVLGFLQNPYFNREAYRFCSFLHTPPKAEDVSAGITVGRDGGYVAWDLFEAYDKTGEFIYKRMFAELLDTLLGDRKTLETDLPAQGIVTLMDQKSERRLVNHLLYASPVKKGETEVIEDILPVYDVSVTLRTEREIRKVTLVPQMEELPFRREGTTVRYRVPRLECHQMVELDY